MEVQFRFIDKKDCVIGSSDDFGYKYKCSSFPIGHPSETIHIPRLLDPKLAPFDQHTYWQIRLSQKSVYAIKWRITGLESGDSSRIRTIDLYLVRCINFVLSFRSL